MTPTLPWRIAALVLLLLGLAACQRESAVVAPGDPVAAVRAQALALRENDLARYARLSLPPDLYAASEARWNAAAAGTEAPAAWQREEFAEWLARFTAEDAETALFHAYEQRLAKLEPEIAGQWPMLQATLGIFLKAAIEANSELDREEKAHAQAVVAAVLAWIEPALLTDRERARRAIAELAATARGLGLKDLDQTRQLPLAQALAKGGLLLGGLKRVGRIYGLDLDAALDALEIELIEAEGDHARLRLSYPLLGQRIGFEHAMLRRDGGWYGRNRVESAEAELATPAITADTVQETPADAVAD